MPLTYFASLLNGGTITGPLTVTGLLSTQAGITNTGGAIKGDASGINTTGSLGAINAGGGLGSGLGNVDVPTAGEGLRVAEGSNAKQGAATLAAGTVTVANTTTGATSRIVLTGNADGGTPGFQRVSARTAGTSFTITSSSGTDTSAVAWEMFEAG